LPSHEATRTPEVALSFDNTPDQASGGLCDISSELGTRSLGWKVANLGNCAYEPSTSGGLIPGCPRSEYAGSNCQVRFRLTTQIMQSVLRQSYRGFRISRAGLLRTAFPCFYCTMPVYLKCLYRITQDIVSLHHWTGAFCMDIWELEMRSQMPLVIDFETVPLAFIQGVGESSSTSNADASGQPTAETAQAVAMAAAAAAVVAVAAAPASSMSGAGSPARAAAPCHRR
jgi:hypothetical protein